MVTMAGDGYYSEMNWLGVIGSVIGIFSALASIHVLSMPSAEILALTLESFLWAIWLLLQGAAFYTIYERVKESSFLLAFVFGLIAGLLEIILLIWLSRIPGITDPAEAIVALLQLFILALIGIGSLMVYFLLCAINLFKATDNNIAKITGLLFIVTAVFCFFLLDVGVMIAAVTNAFALLTFAGVSDGVPRQQIGFQRHEQPRGIDLQ